MTKKQSISKLCETLAEICSDDKYVYKEKKRDLQQLCRKMWMTRIKNEKELDRTIDLHRKLCTMKNHKARYTEEVIMREILVGLFLQMDILGEEGMGEEITILQEDYSPETTIELRLCSRLLRYGKEILESKQEKSARYKNRITQALELLDELNQIYDVKGIKELFKRYIYHEDVNIGATALSGLYGYFSGINADKITEKEIERLQKMMAETTERGVVFLCCQILINSGVMDELSAVIIMEDWGKGQKDEWEEDE